MTDPSQKIELEPAVLSFLLSASYRACNEALKKKFHLTDGDIVFISDLDRLVMSGQMSLEAYLIALEDELGATLSDQERDELYAQLLAERFVPFGDRVHPSVMDVARAEGLRLPSTSSLRIYFQPLTYGGAASEVAAVVGLSLTDPILRERLRDVIKSRVKGVRVDAQMTDILMRPVQVGGMGLDAVMARRVLEAFQDIAGRARIFSEEEYSEWRQEEATKKASASVTQGAAMTEDDKEIARIRASMPSRVSESSSALERSLQQTLQRISYRPEEELLSKRFGNVISSRLRDVRSAQEVARVLMRDVKLGGLGLSSEQAETLSKQIDAAYQEFHGGIAQEEQQQRDRQLKEQQQKRDERRRQEAEDHARWFEEKIRARKRDMVHTPFGPLVPAPQGSASLSAQRSEVKISPASAELAEIGLTHRPSLDGVVLRAPHLVGLVEELATMSVLNFRRLAKDPREAMKKILETCDTLGQESLEKRWEGIKAFQASPLQASYVSLVREAFRAATSVSALAQEKHQTDPETLSPEEMSAIIELNSALHF